MNTPGVTWIDPLRLWGGGTLFVLGLSLIGFNVAAAILSVRRRRFVSGIPIFGGVFGALGCWLSNPWGYGSLWWTILVVDPFALFAVGLLLSRLDQNVGKPDVR